MFAAGVRDTRTLKLRIQPLFSHHFASP